MGFYDLAKEERQQTVQRMQRAMEQDFCMGAPQQLLAFFSDPDTYIRKAAYLAAGRIFFTMPGLERNICQMLETLMAAEDFKVRQTAVNAAGEIGKRTFERVRHFFDTGLFDPHHAVRNAVIGSVKKMGAVNPAPVLEWAQGYLHHPDKEVRREICHGIELRGRRYPQDILPLLRQLEWDKTSRVRHTLVHVLGQIAYKKGCLAIVTGALKSWENKELVQSALKEIVKIHHRYRNFSAHSQEEAVRHIRREFPGAALGDSLAGS